MTPTPSSSVSSRWIDALFDAHGIAPGEVEMTVDPRDEMVGFLARLFRGDRDRAELAYFQTGASIANALLQIVSWRFGEPSRVGRLLDFASGYGRITRFLARAIPRRRIWVADIYEDALAFQASELGVHPLRSSLDPAQFAPTERFDAILVTSLFSHLPARLFAAWLEALTALLTPEGVLVFSVHGEGILPPGETMPVDGLLYQEVSESGSLSTGDYGSTWVSEAFVRRALESVSAGRKWTAQRLPRGLCNYQDLWVVVPGDGPLPPLDYRYDPLLTCETCTIEPGGTIRIAGWCGTLGAGVPRAVHVKLDGEAAVALPIHGARPDVAIHLGDGRALNTGWGGTLELKTPRPFAAPLVLSVEDDRGRVVPIQVSSLEAALYDGARNEVSWLERELAAEQSRSREAAAQAAAVLEVREERIAWMEASRFWKLRNRWFALKRALGFDRAPKP